jgi:hypothetical protein
MKKLWLATVVILSLNLSACGGIKEVLWESDRRRQEDQTRPLASFEVNQADDLGKKALGPSPLRAKQEKDKK